ncbi:MAG: type II secretion system protein [Candidatus Nitronauta litoralis]|uniref:Type II secretion system protein n=1 Tax=Candidatus Nitronauta litoralis TaxID=2705533 RepID=A0A7T0G0M8_9BACT|nr:MAG: type II secretion system protein [Candidatus Nitronauta litoralis]
MLKAIFAHLRNRAQKNAGNESGFTLLELLVVVAILAAIAGTAVVALQDTDARASAAAHVAMMDELDKGIREFRVLNRNQYPNRFDSIMQTAAALGTTGTAQLNIAAHEDLALLDLDTVFPQVADAADDAGTPYDESAAGSLAVQRMDDIGINTLRVAYDTTTGGLDPDGTGDCNDYAGLIEDRGNAVVAGNIYLSPAANGCGGDHTLLETSVVMGWAGGSERVTGQPVAGTDIFQTAGALDLTGTDADLPVMMAVGLGPSSTLFDKRALGGMSTVPVYRHVGPLEYNRFTALFLVGETDGAGGAAPVDQVLLLAIVDGAGDTKEEELGEWDGTRNTI